MDLENLQIPKVKAWDQKWRLVAFDVPEKKKISRDNFRKKISQMGLFQFQKSIWIYPYDCEKELMFLAEVLNIAECLTILTVTIEKDKLLKKYFNLL